MHCLCHCSLQEKRRAERAEQQRIRAEKEKERQARLAVSIFASLSSSLHPAGELSRDRKTTGSACPSSEVK